VKITEPGIYEISEADYNADPCAPEISLRSSICWKLIERGSTPRHAWFASPNLNPNFKRENRKQFDLGTACHTALLGKGKAFKIIDADSWRGKDAQAARDAAYAAGETPLLKHEHAEVMAMATAAREQLKALVAAGTIEKIPFGEGETERTLIWRDRGVLCRARLDGLPHDGEWLMDYKTTAASADPAIWQFRQFRQLGYDCQFAFYRRGLEALGIANSPQIAAIVQENYEPYLLSFDRVDDEVIMRANERVEAALKVWARCLKTGVWPGYSIDGYDINLTEKERMAEAKEQPRGEHLASEDIAASL